MFTVYVLYSDIFNKIYIGYTSDIENRIIAHNHPNNKGWTKTFQPWRIIYSENYDNKQQAMMREKQLKTSRGRAFIHSLIAAE
ncbi:MAG: GIY-YIG nuclease family protein [Paludibacteraceae bacterium]|nr:GIY-YIG nuclease family protein [Paludibacteraceae bacterium]